MPVPENGWVCQVNTLGQAQAEAVHADATPKAAERRAGLFTPLRGRRVVQRRR